MALDDLLLSTGVDSLIKLIREKGRIDIESAANALTISPKTIEDWARVLEQEGIISIEYKLTKIYLVWKTYEPEEMKQRRSKVEAKAENVKSDIQVLLEKVEEGGKSISVMQQEIANLKQMKLSPQEIERLKKELSEIQGKYNQDIAAISQKLKDLAKKTDEGKKKAASFGAADQKQGFSAAEIEKELAVLKRFEETINSQISDVENFFNALQTRIEDLRKQVSEGKASHDIAALQSQIEELHSQRKELAEAAAAIADEQKAFGSKLAQIEKRLADVIEEENKIFSSKKKMEEIKKMSQEAEKQKKAVQKHLLETSSKIKEHISTLENALREYKSSASSSGILEEYIQISEELSRANENLMARQKDIGKKISQQLADLELAKNFAAKAHYDDELEKVAFLLRELEHEHGKLKDKIKALAKEAEIIAMGSKGDASGGAPPSASKAEKEGHGRQLIEKVKLSQKEEAEFEKKREELRSLIRKMWEESKDSKNLP